MGDNKYSLLRKLLKALGLSGERIEELIGWIQTWLQDDREEKTDQAAYPYQLRDDFLSPAEQNFFRVLQTAAGQWATIAPKVSLGDLFFAKTGNYTQNRIYRNKIDRKHVDFLFIDPLTLRPILGIELDDSSHRRQDRQARDQFVDHVFAAAGLPIAHIPVRRSYQPAQLRDFLQQTAGLGPSDSGLTEPEAAVSAPLEPAVRACPECGSEMILRTARSGAHAGNQFWGCSTYPRCRGIRQLAE